MVPRHVATPRPGRHPRAGSAPASATPHTTEPRAPAPDHLVLCTLDCARPVDQCHCLRGMLEDRGLAAIRLSIAPQPPTDWSPPHTTEPGAPSLDLEPRAARTQLILACAALTAAACFAIAWWLG